MNALAFKSTFGIMIDLLSRIGYGILYKTSSPFIIPKQVSYVRVNKFYDTQKGGTVL